MKSSANRIRDRKTPVAQSAEDRIAEAALEAFAAHGFDGVSTTEIAARAGISQPMVYYHFATKEEMWRAAVNRLFERIMVTFPVNRDELRDVDAATRLKIMLRRFVRISARYPALGQLVVHEGARGGPRLQWLVQTHFRQHYDVWDGLIESAQRDGSIKKFPAWIITMMVTAAAASMFNFPPLIRESWGEDVFDEKNVETQADAIVEILFNGLLRDKKERPAR